MCGYFFKIYGICFKENEEELNNIMDTNIGAKERVTQNRLIGLFKNVLKYTCLGNWETREGNVNIEEKLIK